MAMQMGQVKRRWPRIWLWLSPTQREWNQSPQLSHEIMAAEARGRRDVGMLGVEGMHLVETHVKKGGAPSTLHTYGFPPPAPPQLTVHGGGSVERLLAQAVERLVVGAELGGGHAARAWLPRRNQPLLLLREEQGVLRQLVSTHRCEQLTSSHRSGCSQRHPHMRRPSP